MTQTKEERIQTWKRWKIYVKQSPKRLKIEHQYDNHKQKICSVLMEYQYAYRWEQNVFYAVVLCSESGRRWDWHIVEKMEPWELK